MHEVQGDVELNARWASFINRVTATSGLSPFRCVHDFFHTGESDIRGIGFSDICRRDGKTFQLKRPRLCSVITAGKNKG